MKPWIVAVVLGGAGLAAAQEKPEYLLTHKQTKEKLETTKCVEVPPPPGPTGPWEFKLRVGSLFQFNSNKSVIGQRDGASKSLGGEVHGEANWKRNRHEVRNRIDASTVFIKTPNTRGWVSATNFLELENIYQYRLLPWFGPFTRLGVTTQMFVGRDLRTNSVQYQFPDGSLSEPRTELRLTDPFRPVTLLETAGMFVNPVRLPAFDLDFRGGVGARQVFADGQRGVKDDDMTPGIVEIIDLKDYSQVGLELIAMTRGELFAQRVQYFFGGEFLLPVIRNKEPGDNRNNVDLIDKKVRLGVAYKIASWATILFEVRLVHQPQLLDQYQIQTGFGFKGSYTVL